MGADGDAVSAQTDRGIPSRANTSRRRGREDDADLLLCKIEILQAQRLVVESLAAF